MMSTIWAPLSIGAGGFITGIDIASDNTKVCRTDVYGAYKYTGTRWQQLVTMQSMPVADSGIDNEAATFEIRIAPSNTARFYMFYGSGRVFRSDNSGATWTRTAFTQVTLNTSAASRLFGPYIAIDPVNADVVVVGTQTDGAFISSDAGASWSPISAGTASSTATLVSFDPSSSVVGGKTQGIYLHNYGTGTYHSTNGGTSFALTTSPPTTAVHIFCAADGVLYLAPDDGTVNLKFYNGTWNSVSTGTATGRVLASVTVDPNNVNRIVVIAANGDLSVSTNHAASFAGYTAAPSTSVRVANDIPWLAWTNEAFMGTGDIRFDSSSLLWFAEGIGVWTTTPNDTSTNAVTYTSVSLGIEELVSNSITVPAAGKPVLSFWDRPVFYSSSPTVFPSTHGGANALAHNIIFGWCVSHAPGTNTVISLINDLGANDESGISSDGGQTWSKFATIPTGVPTSFPGGSMAASTATNFIWVPSDNSANIWFSTDAGATWNASTVPGVPTTGTTGWGVNATFKRYIACADQVTAGTFYVANSGSSAPGVYRSTDGGANYTKVFTGEFTSAGIDGFNAKMKCVPNNAGHLFYTAGPVGGSTAGSFFRSTNGGANWTAIPNILEVYAFGFGKARSGGYPALYIAGFLNSVWGIYRSEDADQASPTWTALGDGFPLGIFSSVVAVDGDPGTFGTVYVGFQGMAFAIGTEAPTSGGFFVKTSGPSSPRVLVLVRRTA